MGEYLSDKFLLVLGCNYPNWLFRFFWHSIKNFTIVPSTSEMQGVVTVPSDNDEDLITFLSRVQTSVYSNAEDFINEFISRYSLRSCKMEESVELSTNVIEYTDAPCDIFISYAEEDVQIAMEIAELLRNLGATVWFDKSKLTLGDNYEKIIKEMIANCQRFIPILSRRTSHLS